MREVLQNFTEIVELDDLYGQQAQTPVPPEDARKSRMSATRKLVFG